MKICTVWGDLTSDKTSENYPTNLYCEKCFKAMGPDQENSRIVEYKDDDGAYGDVCVRCEKTREEEELENK